MVCRLAAGGNRIRTLGPRYTDDAFETILVAWLAFAFLPEGPTRSQGGTVGSNPLSSSAESSTNRSHGVPGQMSADHRLASRPTLTTDLSKRSNSPAMSVRFGHRPEAGCINVTECPQLNRHQLGEPHR
jgi:hypothetical protein